MGIVLDERGSCYLTPEAAPYRGATMVQDALEKRSSRVERPVISIVDDDASQRSATLRLLRAMGFVAHAFGSAQEFLLSPLLNGTSCLIADVEMPGMSGVKLQEQLIADGNTTPMIFITAFPEDRIREQAMKAGAIGFLTKPFDDSRLLECVEQALKKRRDVSDQA
jgi:FixJ family two-component response regulator